MRRWFLFNNLVFAVKYGNAGSSAAAFCNPVVKSAASMHRHIRGKLLSASTRAVIAASAGSYAFPSSEWDAGQAPAERRRPKAYSRGWLRPSYPAAALSRATSSSKSNAGSAGRLGFRGPSGTFTSDGGPCSVLLNVELNATVVSTVVGGISILRRDGLPGST